MKKVVENIYKKTEEVLFLDKLKVPTEVSRIISKEIEYVLSQYFSLKENSFKSNILLEKDGDMSIYFSFKASRILLKRTGIN